jgi:uncharacterized membrane protein (UPF0127 family)
MVWDRRALNPWTRFVGLLARNNLRPGEGLHITPCSSIHTCFMRFPIDLLYLNREGVAVKSVPALKPFRFSGGDRGAHSVLELPAGTVAQTGSEAGDRVTLTER